MAPLTTYVKPLLVLGAATATLTNAFVLPSARPLPSSAMATAAAKTSPLFTRTTSSIPTTTRPAQDTAVFATNFFDSFFAPKNKGAGKAGNKKTVVLTGTSSGLGKGTLKALCARGDYFVICGVRDVAKMQRVAEELNLDPSLFTIRSLDLSSFDSVRKFAKDVKAVKGGKPLDALVCNAAVYLPALPTPTFTPDGIEESLQINHLSHFLLVSLLIEDLKKAKDPRCIIVGSITGNDNTIAGAFVWPRASLGDLKGMEEGAKMPVSMIDGKAFNGAKAYKDSKVGNGGSEGGRERVHRSVCCSSFSFDIANASSSHVNPPSLLSTRPSFPTDVQHDDGQRAPSPLPRLDGNHLQYHVPRLHRRDGSLPGETTMVPDDFPPLHEVRHGGLCL